LRCAEHSHKNAGPQARAYAKGGVCGNYMADGLENLFDAPRRVIILEFTAPI